MAYLQVVHEYSQNIVDISEDWFFSKAICFFVLFKKVIYKIVSQDFMTRVQVYISLIISSSLINISNLLYFCLHWGQWGLGINLARKESKITLHIY